jgi:hypothetical protein
VLQEKFGSTFPVVSAADFRFPGPLVYQSQDYNLVKVSYHSQPTFFANHNQHLQALFQLFIENASFINLEDGNWHYFLLYNTTATSEKQLQAFCTCFEH